MEFPHRRVAGFQHLHIELGGDGLDLLRRQAGNETVHHLAPGPEGIIARARALGEAGHGPLEGVAVQVCHAGDHRTREALGPLARVTGFNPQKIAAPIDLEENVICPTCGQQRLRGEEACLDHGGWYDLCQGSAEAM